MPNMEMLIKHEKKLSEYNEWSNKETNKQAKIDKLVSMDVIISKKPHT